MFSERYFNKFFRADTAFVCTFIHGPVLLLKIKSSAYVDRLCAGFGLMLTVKAREAEHADLVSDVLPGSWGAESL